MHRILQSDFFNTKAKMSACVHNIMYGIRPKKVYQYKTIVNRSKYIFTTRKRSLRRLCFYRCLSVHRGHAWQGACVAGCVWWGGMHGRGACVAGGMCGVCMAGGHAWQGGVCGRHACPLADTTRYGQWVGSTHPTGMHSCFPKKIVREQFVNME